MTTNTTATNTTVAAEYLVDVDGTHVWCAPAVGPTDTDFSASESALAIARRQFPRAACRLVRDERGRIVRRPSTRPQAARVAQDAATALRRALICYERLSAMPRPLQLPLVGDIDSVVRAERRLRAAGNAVRANEYAELAEREYERRRLADLWRRGRLHRSARAWCAISYRLERAIYDAIEAGVIAGDRVQYCVDRQLDARSQFELAHLREEQAVREMREALN